MEFLFTPISLYANEKISSQMKKAICKIIIQNQSHMYPGFLCKLPLPNDEYYKVLITTYNVLDSIEKNDNKFIIKFFDTNFKTIKIDESRKIYKDKESGLLFIEMMSDETSKNIFLELDDILSKEEEKEEKEEEEEEEEKTEEKSNNIYNNKYVYLIHYLNGDISVSYGKISDIKNIENNQIKSLGSPIFFFSLDNFKVIGILGSISSIIGYSLINYFSTISQLLKTQISKIKTEEQNELILKYINIPQNKIFGSHFVAKNIDNCKMMIDKKEYELSVSYNGKIKEIRLIEKKPITDLSYMFNDCDIESIDFSKWNRTNITNLSYMFFRCHYLNSIINISNLKIDNVENLCSMFYECYSLNNLNGISNWNTSKVTNMSSMFYDCKNLKSLPDISLWNTSKVTDISFMFYNCSSIQYLPDISKWVTNNVVNMDSLFLRCQSIEYLPDISKWNTSKVTNMRYMFYNCSSLKNLPDISKWDKSNLLNKVRMFDGCNSLKSLPNF